MIGHAVLQLLLFLQIQGILTLYSYEGCLLQSTKPRPCQTELADIAVLPSSPSFTAFSNVGLAQYNNPASSPLFVAAPRNEGDIQRVLQCATREGLKVSPKGGGHDYAGFSQVGSYAPTGIQLSLQQHMKDISFEIYNGEPALRIGAGAVFSSVNEFLNTSYPQYLLAGGMCPSVGVAGFTLGGGLGMIERMYGMGVDNVLEMRMVTGKGERVVVANDQKNSDLFWALRGGGGPSFGIVTDFVIRLHPSVPKYSYGELCEGTTRREIEDNLDALARFTRASDFPDWLTVDWRLVKRPNTKHSGLCYLFYSLRGRAETLVALRVLLQPRGRHGYKLARSNRDLDRHIDKMFALKSPLGKTHATGQFAFFEEFDNYIALTLANARYKGYEIVATYPSLSRSYFVENLTPSLNEVIVDWYDRMPMTSERGSCALQGLALGGSVISSVPVDATAFPWRSRILYTAESECTIIDPNFTDESNTWSRGFVDAIKPWKIGAYLGFPWRDLPDFQRNYYGVALPRLQRVKEHWRPDSGPLDFPQEISGKTVSRYGRWTNREDKGVGYHDHDQTKDGKQEKGGHATGFRHKGKDEWRQDREYHTSYNYH